MHIANNLVWFLFLLRFDVLHALTYAGDGERTTGNVARPEGHLLTSGPVTDALYLI